MDSYVMNGPWLMHTHTMHTIQMYFCLPFSPSHTQTSAHFTTFSLHSTCPHRQAASRGVHLWFHHNTILNRLIGQQYDICQYQMSAAIRFWFNSGACDWYETILWSFYTTSYIHALTLAHQLTKKQLNYNFIILFLCSSGYLKQKNNT